MKQQITRSSPSAPSRKTDDAKTEPNNEELSDVSLSEVSGGTGVNLAKACATGKHIPEVKL